MARKPKTGDDSEWLLKEYQRILQHVNDETADPKTVMFRLLGALLAALAAAQKTDVFRLASGLADNADYIQQNEGQIPPLKADMN